MDTSTSDSTTLIAAVDRQDSRQNNSIVKIRPIKSKELPSVQPMSRSTTIHITSAFKVLNTRIQAEDIPSYEPLVTISDHEQTDEEDFVLPIPRLTKDELREEFRVFQSSNDNSIDTINALLEDNDTDELQFRAQQPIKRCICCCQYPFSIRRAFCAIS